MPSYQYKTTQHFSASPATSTVWGTLLKLPIEELFNQYLTIQERLSQSEDACKAKSYEIRSFASSLEAKERKVSELTKANIELGNDNNKLSQENKRLWERNKVTNHLRDDMERIQAASEVQIKDLRSENQELERKLTEAREELQKFKTPYHHHHYYRR